MKNKKVVANDDVVVQDTVIFKGTNGVVKMYPSPKNIDLTVFEGIFFQGDDIIRLYLDEQVVIDKFDHV